MMGRNSRVFHRSPKILTRTIRGGLLVFLMGTLVALAGTPVHLEEALQAQRELVAASPTDRQLLNDLGNLLSLAGEMEEAETTYRRALELDPQHIPSLYNLALLLRDQGEIKEPQKIFETILELDPRHAWAHYQLGTLYTELKYRSRAIEHYSRAFIEDRSLASPRVNPHIVANGLATDALLKNYIERAPTTQPPKLYEKPGSVASLLLQQESVEAAPEAEDDSTSTGRPVSSGMGRVPSEPDDPGQSETEDSMPMAGADEPDRGSTESTEHRRVDDSTIRVRRSGQAVAAESGQELGSRTVGTTPQSGASASTGQTGDVAGQPTSSPLAATDEPAAFQADPAESSGQFRPGTNSTGRLEIRLLPADPGTSVTRPT